MASKIDATIKKLHRIYPINNFAGCEKPFEVLIATILSQRTRDENTEKASEQLFRKYDTPEKIASAPLKKIEKLIKPSGFYKTKAKRIREVSKIINKKYGGKVPADFDKLLALPGVGRKTANCVLVYGFGKKAIPVDTHVHRISNRLGIVKTKTPEQTELKLIKKVPKKYWLMYNELFVKFGQDMCRPMGPKCDICHLTNLCEHYGRTKK